MRRIVLPVVLAAAAAAVLGVRLLGRGAKDEYRLVEVTRGDIRSAVSATGRLQAITTVEVGTQVSGQIDRILVDFNDRVKANQLIARIDPTLLQQAVRTAEAELARGRAELAQARQSLERVEGLFATGVATAEGRDAARVQFDVAQAAATAAEVSVERARQNLSYTEIRSPIDGVVLDRTVDVGQTVAASLAAPQLFLIAGDLANMEILAAVDESDIGKIHDGQRAEFTVQAYPDEVFAGTVRQVRLQSATQDNVVSYTVAVSVRNEDGRLLPGMTATVDFLVAEAKDVLQAPNAALRFRPTAEMMAALRSARREGAGGEGGAEGDGAHQAGAVRRERRPGGFASGRPADRALLWHLDAGGKPTATPVQLGLTDGQATEIRGEGIAEGMKVIAGVVSSANAAVNPFQAEGRPGPRLPGP